MTVDALRHILQRTGDWEMFMLTITCLWHQSIAVMSTAMVKLLVWLKVTIPEVYVLHPWLPCTIWCAYKKARYILPGIIAALIKGKGALVWH